MGVGTSRSDAWELVCEWTQSDSLRRHMLAVEAAMRAYAPRFGGDVELWGLTGLLHDLDYERYPGPRRPAIRAIAMAELRERGYPEELIRAVGSHADFLGISRDTDMEKALIRGRRAVRVRAGGGLCAARGPQRDDRQVRQEEDEAAELRGGGRTATSCSPARAGLGIEFDEHVEIVIAALAASADELLPAG